MSIHCGRLYPYGHVENLESLGSYKMVPLSFEVIDPTPIFHHQQCQTEKNHTNSLLSKFLRLQFKREKTSAVFYVQSCQWPICTNLYIFRISKDRRRWWPSIFKTSCFSLFPEAMQYCQLRKNSLITSPLTWFFKYWARRQKPLTCVKTMFRCHISQGGTTKRQTNCPFFP